MSSNEKVAEFFKIYSLGKRATQLLLQTESIIVRQGGDLTFKHNVTWRAYIKDQYTMGQGEGDSAQAAVDELIEKLNLFHMAEIIQETYDKESE